MTIPNFRTNPQTGDLEAEVVVSTNRKGWAKAILLVSDDGKEALSNAYRGASVLHRNAITRQDKIATLASSLVTATTEAGGSLATGTPYNWAVVPGNKYGSAGIPSAGGVGTTNTGTDTALRLAWSAVTGAEYYDLFLSTDAAPKFAGRVTEGQRLAGGLLTTASTGTAGAVIGVGGTAEAIDVRVVGSGQQTSAANLAQNNAYTPDLPTAVDCAGHSLAHIQVAASVVDLFAAPTVSAIAFLKNDNDTFFHQAKIIAVPLLTGADTTLRQESVIQLDGSSGLVVCLSGFAGNGLSVNVAVQLA